jgi:hypothetical protein
MCDGGRSDPQVVRSDHVTAFGEFGPHPGVHSSNLVGDRDCGQPGEQMLDERVALRAAGSARSMHAMEEFAHRDDANCPLLIAEKPVDFRVANAVLGIDQKIRVD